MPDEDYDAVIAEGAARIAAAASRPSTRSSTKKGAGQETAAAEVADVTPLPEQNSERKLNGYRRVRDDLATGIKVYLAVAFVLMFFAPELAGAMIVPVLLLLAVGFIRFLWDALFGPGEWPHHF